MTKHSPKINDLKIEITSLSEILPYIGNAKEHPEWHVKQIAASIQEFGFNDPIAIDENNVIIEGHGRVLAAEVLNLETVPVIRLTHMSEAQKKAYIIAHNKLTMNTGFELDKLKMEFESLGEMDIDLELSGFDLDEIGKLLPESEGLTEDDAIPENVEAVCQVGDLWQLGNHRLLCGDSTDVEQVERLMDGQKADILITDPPYNVNYAGGTKDKLKIINDKQEDVDFKLFLSEAFINANHVLKAGGVFYIWHADSEGYNFRGACIDAGWTVRQCLIWNKNAMVMGRQDYHWKHEPCLYGWKDGAGHLWASDRKQVTVLSFDRHVKSKIHPTMKPVELFVYQITNNTKGEDIVIDLFLGSGTSVIACEKTNRKCYGMELDPIYCDVIIKRWEEYTGKNARCLNKKST